MTFVISGIKLQKKGRLGHAQEYALWRIIQSRNGLPYYLAIGPVTGNARRYAGRYIAALRSVILENLDVFEEGPVGVKGGFGAKLKGELHSKLAVFSNLKG